MKRALNHLTAKASAAWIILILAVLALPASAVLAAQTQTQDEDALRINKTHSNARQIPTWAPPLNSEFDNLPVVYDPVNGAVEQPEINEPKSPLSHATEYSDRSANWPTSTTVKVIATWPASETPTECSGVLITETAILTAGHCVFTHTAENCHSEDSCWAENLEIFLYDGNQERQSSFKEILTWTAWTENHDFDYDLAGVRLTQAFGKQAGWLGFGNNIDDLIFSNAIWKFSSVPSNAENPPITSALFRFSGIQNQLFYSDGPSSYGQSGAGAYSSENEYKHIVYSVLSHQRLFGENIFTGFTRITQVNFFALRDWIKSFDFNIYLPLFID